MGAVAGPRGGVRFDATALVSLTSAKTSNCTQPKYVASWRLGGLGANSAAYFFPCSAFTTLPGDIGSMFMRMPSALWIALAMAAGGATIGTSPTPRTP